MSSCARRECASAVAIWRIQNEPTRATRARPMAVSANAIDDALCTHNMRLRPNEPALLFYASYKYIICHYHVLMMLLVLHMLDLTCDETEANTATATKSSGALHCSSMCAIALILLLVRPYNSVVSAEPIVRRSRLLNNANSCAEFNAQKKQCPVRMCDSNTQSRAHTHTHTNNRSTN